MDNINNKLNVNITPELAGGKYSNLAFIGHSSSEFILDFASVLPGQPNMANIQSRVIMSPEHTKRLLFALQENIQRYEAQFGKITFNNGAPVINGPIVSGGGEA